MQHWKYLIILMICLLLISAAPMQDEQSSVVRAVFFYSPTCPHCHDVIENVLPPLVKKYGPQLLIIGINTQTSEGQALYQSMVTHFEVSEERLGVPTLIVGDTHLVGSTEIPEQFPGIIEEGLKQGGIAWPTIPGFDAVLATSTGETSEAQGEVSAPKAENGEVLITQPTTLLGDQSMLDKFKLDPVANSIAVIILIGMIVSTIIVVLRSEKDAFPIKPWLRWVIPVLSVVGLFVAGYLSYVEITQTEAVCGPVGDCNTVQQSPFARLFGVLPIGVMGLAGYIAILISWSIQYYGPDRLRSLSAQAVWGMALFGTLFSIYLTFLEPFVIGATCAWCLTSAIVITLILLVSTDSVREIPQ